MSSGLLPPTKGRLGSRKSTNGCITCKIRKVKCDEQKPLCYRCLSTGRRCDGYQKTLTKDESSSPARAHQITKMRTYGSSDHREVQAFEYFISQVLPDFTQIIDDEFWHRILPQLSHTEPWLWHAVVAMSCLIQFPQYSASPTPPTSPRAPISNENHQRALTWYGRSISSLRVRIQANPSRSSIAVIACILFACIECLQDRTGEAVILYRHAVSMIGLGAPTQPEQIDMAESESQLDYKTRAMLRHETMSHGLPVPRPKILLDSTSGSFQLLSDAREELYALVTEAQAFIQQVVVIKEMEGKEWVAPSDLIIQQERHQTDLLRWHSAFSNTTSSPDKTELRSVLLIAYTQYFIWLSVCLSTFETAYDGFLPYFETIVQHSERVIERRKSNGRSVFLFESRVIPSLYFVAIKCRDSWLRRRALSLLRSGPQMENLWKAEPMALVAERSIDVEEIGWSDGKRDQIQPSKGEKLPPECDRVDKQEVVDLRRDANGPPDYHLVLSGWRQDEQAQLQWSRTTRTIKLDPV